MTDPPLGVGVGDPTPGVVEGVVEGTNDPSCGDPCCELTVADRTSLSGSVNKNRPINMVINSKIQAAISTVFCLFIQVG